MKHTFKSILFAVLTAFALTACDKDLDSNPVLDVSHTAEGFVLNVPALAANNTYDLAHAQKIVLTTSQPNYGGVPYATRYYVQVSLDEQFTKTAENVEFTELSTSYTTAKMGVDAAELNDALVKLYQKANPDTDVPTTAMKAFVRLRAIIDGTALGETFSNTITLPNVIVTYVAPKAVLPTEVFVVGSSVQTPWTSWKPVTQVYGMPGNFYTMIYVPEGGAFKWGTFNNDWRGFNRLRSVNDKADAGITESTDGNSNITVAKAGWYVLHFAAEIVGNSIQFDLNVYPGQAHLIGAAAGGAWNDGDALWALTPASGENGVWTSPAFAGAGEMRAYIKVPGFDWWRTEFTLHQGNVVWRTMDIPDNWAANVGEDYSVQAVPGQKLYVDFNNNTGEVK